MSCNLDKDAKLVYGHYGSKAFISIKNKDVYKYFPIMLHYLENDVSIKNWSRKINSEIQIFKILKDDFIDTKKSPHIVRLLKINECKNKPQFYNNCKLDTFKNLIENTNSSDNNIYCQYVSRFPKFKIEKPMMIIKLEYCDYDLNYLLSNKILNESFSQIKSLLNQIIFQVLFTVQVIKDKYPDFIHKDLLIKNVLCIKNKFIANKYYRYHYKNIIYDVPVSNYIPKITDFGITQLNNKYGNFISWIPHSLLKDDYKDHYSFLMDLFNTIINHIKKKQLNNLEKINNINNYFNNFFDTNALNLVINNNRLRYFLYNDSTEVEGYVNFIKLKKRYQILKEFKNIFKYDESHEIIEEYNK